MGEANQEREPRASGIDVTNIQGNIVAGFNKDNQIIMFLGFPESEERTRNWIAHMSRWVATTEEVRAFNDVFRLTRARRPDDREPLSATWVQLLFTAEGLRKLDVPAEEIQLLDPAFAQGMSARAELLGDSGDSAPAEWHPPFGRGEIHAAVIVASDNDHDLRKECDALERRFLTHGLKLLWKQEGHTLPDPLRGHEHFGFKDGISQPTVAEFDTPPPSGPPSVPAGDFVLGYPDGSGDTRDVPGWARDGSLAVFRRLNQDVAGFRGFLAALSAEVGLSPDQLGAKMVGRWKSGAATDQAPDADGPTLVGQDSNNSFTYADDAEGFRTPRFAHIRKVFPRDQAPNPPAGDAHRRRILRRGAPFGPILPDAPSEKQIEKERGLLFICFQASLVDQFEFIQRLWCNASDFPTGPVPPVDGYQPTPGVPGDGPDPIVGMHHGQGVNNLKRPGVSDQRVALQQFVRTTGGEYLFCPSISALEGWAR